MGKNKYKDMRGVLIQEGDYLAYGKSNRHDPVSLGTVMEILDDGISVLGDGNCKTGKLSEYDIGKRVLVLPDDYKIY